MSAPGGEAGVIRRMEIMNMSKSVLNAILIDSEEDYTRDNASLAGIPEIIDRFMLMVTGSTGIPVTRLFGRSPGGLNATVENDLRNYYDLVESAQGSTLKAPLSRFYKLLAVSLGIKDKVKFTFNSLYQMTEIEHSEKAQRDASTEQTKVNTMMSLVNMGALDADEVRHEYLGKKGSVKPEDVEEPEGYDVGGDPRKQPKDKDSDSTDKGKEGVKSSENPGPKTKTGKSVKARAK
jgi:phage-related protein (TIGR01555 family)